MIVGVFGFGRSGLTMVMRMLDAGGIPPVDGSAERSYEVGVSDLLWLVNHPDDSVLEDGRAVKLLDLPGRLADPEFRDLRGFEVDHVKGDLDWRCVWLDRDPWQMARSTAKLLAAAEVTTLGEAGIADLRQSYDRDRPAMLEAVAALGPVLVLRYEKVIESPRSAAARLAEFVGISGEGAVAAMAGAVHVRSPHVRPHLDFDVLGVVPEPERWRR